VAEENLVGLIKNLALTLDESRRETREQFEQVEGAIRQVHVQIEGLHGKIEQVAEGVSNVEEKLDRHAQANEQQFEGLRTTIHLSHTYLQKRDDDLDARVIVLETSRR
jgi:predicted  nucleic acid-binding Zn-ribbon protein